MRSGGEEMGNWSHSESHLSLYRSPDQESYSIEFVFDADVKCAVTVHYKATEDLSTGLAM